MPRSPLTGTLEAWLPDGDVLRGSPFLSAIPRAFQRPQRPGRLYIASRFNRHVPPTHDPVAPMIPRLLAGITRAILEGNAEMPQEALSGVRTGRTRSMAEALHDAVREAYREGLRPSTLVVHPRMMARVYRELAIDPTLYTVEGRMDVHGIEVMPDRTLPEGSAYLVDPSQLLLAHAGASPITVSQSYSDADEIEVRLAYTAQVIATHHRAITQLMIESGTEICPEADAVTNNVLPARTAWDRILDDYLGEAA